MTRARRYGIFGGTFDPVHFGHLLVAEEAAVRLDLDRVVFLPAFRPAHKRRRTLAPVAHRLAMLRLAVRGNPRFEISDFEASKGEVAYTADTLAAFAEGRRGSLYFILGQDSLEEFDSWHAPDSILRLARLVVIPRGDRVWPRLRPALRRRTVVLRSPRVGISSSEIRNRIRGHRSCRYWTPDPVRAYIARHGLYQDRRRG